MNSREKDAKFAAFAEFFEDLAMGMRIESCRFRLGAFWHSPGNCASFPPLAEEGRETAAASRCPFGLVLPRAYCQTLPSSGMVAALKNV